MRSIASFASLLLLVALAGCGDAAGPLGHSAEGVLASASPVGELRYELTLLPSLGGAQSRGAALTEGGTVAGFSELAGSGLRQATVWQDGQPRGLGSLGGGDTRSAVIWRGLNERGTIVGISETDEVDPRGQSWSCILGQFFIGDPRDRVCVGFVWEAGEMRRLPTLGGHNGFATGVNNRGEVVGWAETAVEDPTCDGAHQVLQFRGVVWGPGRDQMRELPPLPGDSASAATAINERGQVVGISGDCGVAVGGVSARRAVLWERGEAVDLGSLGGSPWNTPMAINARGDVVGFSNVVEDPAGGFNAQAFLWTRSGGMEDLGTLGEDPLSQAHGINARRQVVGVSYGRQEPGPRAFLWQNGVMRDLNTLLVEASPYILIDARDISASGKITGWALPPDGLERLAYVATPAPGRRPFQDSRP